MLFACMKCGEGTGIISLYSHSGNVGGGSDRMRYRSLHTCNTNQPINHPIVVIINIIVLSGWFVLYVR